MFHALDMGVSAADFWEMSPRAVVMLHRELRRSQDAARRVTGRTGPRAPQGRRLNYIPRP